MHLNRTVTDYKYIWKIEEIRKRNKHIVRLKRTLAGSYAAPGKYAEGTDGQADGRLTVTLSFPLDAASVINNHITRAFNFKLVEMGAFFSRLI